MVLGHLLVQAGVFLTHRDQLQGRASIPLGVVTSLFACRRTCFVYESEWLREYENQNKSAWAAYPLAVYGPPVFCFFCLFFFVLWQFLWVSFSVKKPCCLQYNISSHSCRWTCLCFWTISYAIVCHHGYHTDQKHANRRIVVTGLESGGNIQLFTVCFSLNECASALIFK